MTERTAAFASPEGALLPYVEIPSIPLGPLSVEPFGVLAALGVLVGARIAERSARRQGIDPAPLASFVTWALVGGILGGHLVHLFLYHPEELDKHPLQVLRVWDGLSSFGGLLGALVTAAIWFRAKGLSFAKYGDALALGVAPGWGIARLGCFAVHDHPGRLTDFPLAVAFPEGARHDLGLYDAIVLFSLAALVWTLHRRGVLKGFLLPLLALGYGLARFGLDFLRASDLPYVDARYFGLTPGQYFCIALVGWGVWRLSRGGFGTAPRVAAA